MSELKVAALKEALAAQQVLLKKLYNDLDVEREASSTAASEALSMILRLQDEKAAVKMEAEQYKRLAEEKMSYAEETMEIFKDLVYQKEMEISALDFQVQAYRNKLLDIGFDDSGDGEIDFPENNLRRSEASSCSSVGDLASLVPTPRLPFIKTVHEIKGSESPEDDLILQGVEKQLDHNSELEKQNIFGSGNINSYWEQIRKLDDRVREITGEPNTRLQSPSPSPQLSRSESCATIKRTIAKECDHLKHPLGKEVCMNSHSSTIIYDVFEVPQPTENFCRGEDLLIKEGKAPLQDNGKGAKQHFISSKAYRQFLKGQDDCSDKGLISEHRELNLSPPPERESIDTPLKIVQSTGACRDKIQQANNLAVISEIQSQTLRHECTDVARVELHLLNEIQKQLNVIHSEIKSLKPRKSSSLENLRVHCLEEVLLLTFLHLCIS